MPLEDRFYCAAIYGMEYNIDNVNITDRVVYFVLQELTSQLMMMKASFCYMWRVIRVTSMW